MTHMEHCTHVSGMNTPTLWKEVQNLTAALERKKHVAKNMEIKIHKSLQS